MFWMNFIDLNINNHSRDLKRKLKFILGLKENPEGDL